MIEAPKIRNSGYVTSEYNRKAKKKNFSFFIIVFKETREKPIRDYEIGINYDVYSVIER